jgi:hypothetical protein
VTTLTTQIGHATGAGEADVDELLSTRLRDLALVDLDALTAGVEGAARAELVAAFADDIADALREARARMAVLRGPLGGGDPLAILETTPRQRASDAAVAGAERLRVRLGQQAEAARGFARLADLAAVLAPRLFEADRRR